MTDRIHVSTAAKYMLWAKTAGRCEICGRLLTEDPHFKSPGNLSNFAHIRAYSSNGPRFDPTYTKKETNEIGNLILLCNACHTVVDNSPDVFPVEMLEEYKSRHETAIEKAGEALRTAGLDVLLYVVPFDGRDVGIEESEWRKGLLSINSVPATARPYELNTSSSRHAAHHSIESLATDMEVGYTRFIEVVHEKEAGIALFAIAPQPLLIKLGTLLGDAKETVVFQRRREAPHWTWCNTAPTPHFIIRSPSKVSEKDAALVLSVSGTVNPESLPSTFRENAAEIYAIEVEGGGSVYAADSRESQDAFRKACTSCLYKIHEKHPGVKRLHIFPAMPTSLNVIFGQTYNPNVFEELILYQKVNGQFEQALTI